MENSARVNRDAAAASHGLAFAGLLLFTILLYLRPNEMFPEFFGDFPIIKIVAIVTLLAYSISKLSKGESITIWPIELKMVAVITCLAVIFIPIAASPQDSIDTLTEAFLKVIVIFVVMINLINTRQRLHLMMKIVVLCGTFISILAINAYLSGNLDKRGFRIANAVAVGGMFGNPNDLATSLDLLLPIAVALALTARGISRVFYSACAVLLVAGVVVTFSRAGFLALVAMGGMLLWKLGRNNRVLTIFAFVIILGVFLSAMPGGYGDRITSIFLAEKDITGSRQARKDLLDRATIVAASHPFIGVGIGNYHIYSLQEKRAHNSYLEISAELGVAGLIAYLIFIFSPLRSLRRKGRDDSSGPGSPAPAAFARHAYAPGEFKVERGREFYYFSVALQASLVAYIVCSFFASIQYQWYAFYIIGYVIALRGIESSYRLTSVDVIEEAASTTIKKGTLWKSYQRAGQTSNLSRSAGSQRATRPGH